MSVDVSSWVWKHSEASGGDLLVLLALADMADHEGLCWPSVATLAQRTRLHEQTVRSRLQALRRDGLIEVESAPGKSNRYRLVMAETASTPTNIATPSDFRTPTNSLEGTPTKTTQSTPTNSFRRGTVIEPSENRHKGDKRGSRIVEGWRPSPLLLEWAKTKSSSVDVDTETENFVDYWLGRPGQGGVKLDWDATWRTWMRRSHERNVQRGWKPAANAWAAEAEASGQEWLLR